MTATGGGFGRFARKKASVPKEAAPPVATNEADRASNDVFGSFVGDGARADTFDNVDMFGGSFDLNFEATATDPTTYDYDASTFDTFGGVGAEVTAKTSDPIPGATTEQNAPSEAMDTDVDAAQKSTTTTQESTIPQPDQDKTDVDSFFAVGNQDPQAPSTTPHGTSVNTAAASTPAARPTTAVPQPSVDKRAPGISLFSRTRKRAAPSQEVPATPKTPSANSQPNKTPGFSGIAAVAVNAGDASNHERVLPPPPTPPSKPLPTGTVTATPTGPSNNNNGIYLPPLGANKEATTPAAATTPIGDVTTLLVTPDCAATGGLPMEQERRASPTSVLPDMDGEDFDDLWSHFFSDLRTGEDLHEKGDADILDCEVDLSQAFALTLGDRSEGLELLDLIEDIDLEHDSVILGMEQF